MKTLYLIRHAKSSWDNPSLSDFARPLNKRGKNDAPFMGAVLMSKNIVPDQIISSSANRAISTARAIAEKVNFNTNDIIEDEKIYHADIIELLKVINALNNEWNTVFLFGHNPGFTYLAEYLSGEHYGSIPTTGIAGFQFEIEDWNAVSKNSGVNIFFDYPKNHY